MKSTRRTFCALTATSLGFPSILGATTAVQSPVLGQGEWKYRPVPGWGQLGVSTPVGNCHGLVTDREGHLILLTDHPANNIIIYDKSGKLVHKWGNLFPEAHGLSLVEEGGHELLYITCLKKRKVFRTSLTGEVLMEWGWPQASPKYKKEIQYRPSWTLHPAEGGFFVLDGYGTDYILHYGTDGKLQNTFGGPEGGIAQWGPHGGMMDAHPNGGPATLLIAMSDQGYLLRVQQDGKVLERTPLPGGNPRQIRRFGDHYFVPHLADNWPKDRSSRGFVSILDRNLKVVSNLAGTPPEYDAAGQLGKMKNTDQVFLHPHDLTMDQDGSLYVAQFDSGNTYPIKLERV